MDKKSIKTTTSIAHGMRIIGIISIIVDYATPFDN